MNRAPQLSLTLTLIYIRIYWLYSAYTVYRVRRRVIIPNYNGERLGQSLVTEEERRKETVQIEIKISSLKTETDRGRQKNMFVAKEINT